MVRDMYISAEQLGENVDGTYRRYEAQDFTVPPLQYAAEHVVPVSRTCCACSPCAHAAACSAE